jgi:hypothetical protein
MRLNASGLGRAAAVARFVANDAGAPHGASSPLGGLGVAVTTRTNPSSAGVGTYARPTPTRTSLATAFFPAFAPISVSASAPCVSSRVTRRNHSYARSSSSSQCRKPKGAATSGDPTTG